MEVDQDPQVIDVAAPAPPPAVSQRIGRVVLALALVLLGLWILHDFLAALAWAAVFAIATWPLYEHLLRMLPAPGQRFTPPLLITLLIGCVFAGPLAYLAIVLARDAHVVIDFVVAARQNGIPAPAWVAGVPIVGRSMTEWWHANLSDPYTAEALFGRVDTRMLAESAREYGGEVVRRVTMFAFTLLTLFFLFRHGTMLSNQLLVLSDRVLGFRGERIARQMILAVHGTVNGLVLVGLAEGVVLGGVYVVVGLPHPALVGAATGVLAVIPFGAPVIFAAAAIFLLTQGSTIPALVVLGAGFAVVFVADHFIRPFLIGGAVRLPFLWVLLGILGGLETFGFLGLFLGPAVMAALMSLWREWTEMPAPAAPRPRPTDRLAPAPPDRRIGGTSVERITRPDPARRP